MNTRPKQLQTIDTTDIYVGNATAVWNFTVDMLTNPSDGSSYAGLIIALASFAALPITATIGAGIKTGIDASDRIPLPLEDIDKSTGVLNDLSNDEVNQIVSTICEFPAQSKSCEKLQSDLKNWDPDNSINKIRLEKENEIIRLAKFESSKKLNTFMEGNGITLFKVTEKHNASYQFSNEENKQIEEYVVAKTPEILEQCRINQVSLISDYLTAPHNAGKKLQHVIVEKAASVEHEVKSQLSLC